MTRTAVDRPAIEVICPMCGRMPLDCTIGSYGEHCFSCDSPVKLADEAKPYLAVWAGYGMDGNDMNGHVHPHPDGTYYPDWNFRPPKKANGVRVGFFCAAPVDRDGFCTDPSERTLRAFMEKPS